jgi:hypothetical protein
MHTRRMTSGLITGWQDSQLEPLQKSYGRKGFCRNRQSMQIVYPELCTLSTSPSQVNSQRSPMGVQSITRNSNGRPQTSFINVSGTPAN